MSDSYRERETRDRSRSPERDRPVVARRSEEEQPSWRQQLLDRSRAAGSALYDISRATSARVSSAVQNATTSAIETVRDPEFQGKVRGVAVGAVSAVVGAGKAAVVGAGKATHGFVTDPGVQSKVLGAVTTTLGAGLALADFVSPYKTLTIDRTVNTPAPAPVVVAAAVRAGGAGAGGAGAVQPVEQYEMIRVSRDVMHRVGRVFSSAPFVPNESFEVFNGPHAYRWMLNNHTFDQNGRSGSRFRTYSDFLLIMRSAATTTTTFQDQIIERVSVFWDGVKNMGNLHARMIAIESNSPLIQQIVDPMAAEPFQTGDIVIFASCFKYPSATEQGTVSLDRVCLNYTAQKERDKIPIEGEGNDTIRSNFIRWMCMPDSVKYKLHVVRIIAPKGSSFGKPIGLKSFIQKYKRKHPKASKRTIVAKYYKALRSLQAYS